MGIQTTVHVIEKSATIGKVPIIYTLHMDGRTMVMQVIFSKLSENMFLGCMEINN